MRSFSACPFRSHPSWRSGFSFHSIGAFIIIVTGLSVTVYSLLFLFGMPQGPGQLFDIAAGSGEFSLGTFDLGLAESTFWVTLAYGIFINLQNFGIDQNYVQRYMSARSERAAKSSALLGSILCIPVSLIFFFIGTALYSFYRAQPGLLPAGIADDGVLPHFIVHQVPAGFTGLLIAAILAAWWSLASVFSGGMLGLFLLGFFSRKASSVDALVGVACGILVILWMSFSSMIFTHGLAKFLQSPLHLNLTIVMGTTTVFLVGFLLSKRLFGTARERPPAVDDGL